MARDYSSRRNNPPNGNGKRKPAKRPKPAARSTARKKPAPRKTAGGNNRARSGPGARSSAPGCVWLLCGLFIGVAGLSIYYIASRPAGHGPQSVSVDLPSNESAGDGDQASAGPSSNDDSTQKTNTAQSQKKTDPRFSFYKMLPNYKVEVPAGQQAPQPITDNHAPHEAEPGTNTPAPKTSGQTASSSSSSGSTQTSQPADAGGYVIQAGAFSTEGDADHRKARLALLGVAAEIVDIRTSSGKTVYRVQSQSFSSRGKAQSLSQRLQSHGIETMVRHAR